MGEGEEGVDGLAGQCGLGGGYAVGVNGGAVGGHGRAQFIHQPLARGRGKTRLQMGLCACKRLMQLAEQRRQRLVDGKLFRWCAPIGFAKR
jgi:hypothetical protein